MEGIGSNVSLSLFFMCVCVWELLKIESVCVWKVRESVSVCVCNSSSSTPHSSHHSRRESPQPTASPPSLPRSSVLAFAPLPALSLRAVGNAASRRLSVRSGGSAFVCGLSRLLWWLLCGVFLLLFYKCKTIVFTFVNYNERSDLWTVL